MNSISNDIKNLSDTSSHKELVAALQKILHKMNFYISQSEGALLEYREDWHSELTSALYKGTRSDGKKSKNHHRSRKSRSSSEQ